MTVVEGGHAIMIDVKIPDDTLEEVSSWVRDDPEHRSAVDEHHLTIAFVGRDLPEEIGREMRAVAREIMIPRIWLRREYRLFGAKKNMLVGMIQPTLYLRQLRYDVVESLKSRDCPVSTGFGFNPHVTLAKCSSEDGSRKGLSSNYENDVELITLGVTVKLGSHLQRISG